MVSWLRAQPLKGRVYMLTAVLVGGGALLMAAVANCQSRRLQHVPSSWTGTGL